MRSVIVVALAIAVSMVSSASASVMATAGELTSINGDGVSGTPPASMYMNATTSGDWWWDGVIDLNPVSGLQKNIEDMTLTRWGSTTNENMREIFISIADEGAVGFDPLDDSFYTTSIGHGHKYNNNTGDDFFVDLTDSTARYLFIHCQSHWMAGSSGSRRILNKDIAVTGTDVPEPATMILLGMGSVALLRRRKK